MPSFDFPEIPMGGASDCNMARYCEKDSLTPPTTSIKITIPGEPVPKGRHRARIVQPRSKPAFIHFYQDADTEAYERRVAQEAGLVMRGRGLLLGALKIDVVAHVSIPASWSEKKRLSCQDTVLLPASVLPTSRPDADNYLKCCLDAMNGVVYKDDSQVVKMSVEKRYSTHPRLEIEIFAV